MNPNPSTPPCDVLVLSAHPDDAEMSIGGTIAALVEAKRAVTILALTKAELSTYGDVATRAREAARAAQILGCSLRQLELPDGAVVDTLENRHRLAALLRELRPSLLLAPYAWSRTGPADGRSNLDHLATGQLAFAASKLARFRKLMPEIPAHSIRRLWYYMLPDDVAPSLCVDVSAQREKLIAAISAYESQMAIQFGARPILELLLLRRQLDGNALGVELAEAFYCPDRIGGAAERLFEL